MPNSRVSKFFLAQRSVLEDGTPVYRARGFPDTEGAKTHMVTDAIDLCIDTIGSYAVAPKGAEVAGLCRKKIDLEEVWI